MGGVVLDLKTDRFFCLVSCSGVSSTMRLAIKRLSSSQPAMAAADLNLGLNNELVPPLVLFPISIGFDSLGWVLGLCFGSSSLTIVGCSGSEKVKGLSSEENKKAEWGLIGFYNGSVLFWIVWCLGKLQRLWFRGSVFDFKKSIKGRNLLNEYFLNVSIRLRLITQLSEGLQYATVHLYSYVRIYKIKILNLKFYLLREFLF